MREFFKMTFACALGNMIAWIALWFFVISQSGCTIELFPIDFNTDVEVTVELDGLCKVEADCPSEFPHCLRIGAEIGICTICYSDDHCEGDSVCTFELICTE